MVLTLEEIVEIKRRDMSPEAQQALAEDDVQGLANATGIPVVMPDGSVIQPKGV